MSRIIADDLIAIAAFRYALGRMTYMVDHVATWLIANVRNLREGDRALIVREIDEADERNGLGMDMDRRRWMNVRSVMLAGFVEPAVALAARKKEG